MVEAELDHVALAPDAPAGIQVFRRLHGDEAAVPDFELEENPQGPVEVLFGEGPEPRHAHRRKAAYLEETPASLAVGGLAPERDPVVHGEDPGVRRIPGDEEVAGVGVVVGDQVGEEVGVGPATGVGRVGVEAAPVEDVVGRDLEEEVLEQDQHRLRALEGGRRLAAVGRVGVQGHGPKGGGRHHVGGAVQEERLEPVGRQLVARVVVEGLATPGSRRPLHGNLGAVFEAEDGQPRAIPQLPHGVRDLEGAVGEEAVHPLRGQMDVGVLGRYHAPRGVRAGGKGRGQEEESGGEPATGRPCHDHGASRASGAEGAPSSRTGAPSTPSAQCDSPSIPPVGPGACVHPAAGLNGMNTPRGFSR